MKKLNSFLISEATIILILLAFVVTVFFISCKKEGNEKADNLCPVVAASAVPQLVKDSFAVRYPATIVITWFYKDSSSYCAAFKMTSVEKLAQFAPNGSFIKEELETEQEGEHNDSTSNGGKIAAGCKCETETKHD